MGISRITVNRLENGKRDFKNEYLEKAAEVLNIAVSELFDKPAIPIVGYIGAGDEVQFVDSYAKGDGMDEVTVEGYYSRSAVGAVIRGHSMRDRNLFDADVLIWDDTRPDVDSFVGKRACVVKLADERIMVKQVVRGAEPGLYTLLSSNFPPIEDVALLWCAKIKLVLQRGD